MIFIRKFTLIYFTIILLSKLSSCTVSTTQLNSTNDKTQAEKVTREFYDRLIADNYNQTLFYYSEKFKKKVNKNQLFAFYKHYKDVDGIIKSVKLIKCHTKSTNNAGVKTSYYTIMYLVQRSINPTKEIFILKALEDEIPKIYRYDIIEYK